jgi:hypothetical protein
MIMANRTERGFLSKIAAKWLRSALQPRFVLGIVITILSFAMVERRTGVPVQYIQPADYNPMRMWCGAEDKVIRVKNRAVQYYENIRLVYQLTRRLKDLQEQQEASGRPRENACPDTHRVIDKAEHPRG